MHILAISTFHSYSVCYAIDGWQGGLAARCNLFSELRQDIEDDVEVELTYNVLVEPKNETHAGVLSDYLGEQGKLAGDIRRASIELRRPGLEPKARRYFLTYRNELIAQWLSNIESSGGIPDFLRTYIAVTSGADPRTAQFIDLPDVTAPELPGETIPGTSLQSTLLTNQFTFLAEENPTSFPHPNGKKLNHPLLPEDEATIERIIERLNKLDSKYTYGLPLMRQWYHALNYQFKDSPSPLSVAHVHDGSFSARHYWHSENSNNKMKPVGTKKPTDAGFYDLIGNAWDITGAPGGHLGAWGGAYDLVLPYINGHHPLWGLSGIRLSRHPKATAEGGSDD